MSQQKTEEKEIDQSNSLFSLFIDPLSLLDQVGFCLNMECEINLFFSKQTLKEDKKNLRLMYQKNQNIKNNSLIKKTTTNFNFWQLLIVTGLATFVFIISKNHAYTHSQKYFTPVNHVRLIDRTSYGEDLAMLKSNYQKFAEVDNYSMVLNEYSRPTGSISMRMLKKLTKSNTEKKETSVDFQKFKYANTNKVNNSFLSRPILQKTIMSINKFVQQAKPMSYPHWIKNQLPVDILKLPDTFLIDANAYEVISSYTIRDYKNEINKGFEEIKNLCENSDEKEVCDKIFNLILKPTQNFLDHKLKNGVMPLHKPFSLKSKKDFDALVEKSKIFMEKKNDKNTNKKNSWVAKFLNEEGKTFESIEYGKIGASTSLLNADERKCFNNLLDRSVNPKLKKFTLVIHHIIPFKNSDIQSSKNYRNHFSYGFPAELVNHESNQVIQFRLFNLLIEECSAFEFGERTQDERKNYHFGYEALSLITRLGEPSDFNFVNELQKPLQKGKLLDHEYSIARKEFFLQEIAIQNRFATHRKYINQLNYDKNQPSFTIKKDEAEKTIRKIKNYDKELKLIIIAQYTVQILLLYYRDIVCA